MGKNTNKLTAYAMFLALSMILGYVESFLPMPFPIPGIKLGLANIVSILGLFSIGAVPTAIITLLRVLLLAILFGNMMTLSYSMAGFLLSFAVMFCAKKCMHFSYLAVSLLGGIFHNLGQILMAVFLLRSPVLFAYFPVLLFAGMLAGIMMGVLSALLEKRLHRRFLDWKNTL